MQKLSPNTRAFLQIRCHAEEREALQRAADANGRTLSAQGRMINYEWLVMQGFLQRKPPSVPLPPKE